MPRLRPSPPLIFRGAIPGAICSTTSNTSTPLIAFICYKFPSYIKNQTGWVVNSSSVATLRCEFLRFSAPSLSGGGGSRGMDDETGEAGRLRV